MTKRLSLTDVGIKALPIPAKGQQTYFDEQLPGFGVRISQGGSRSFVVMFGPKRQLHTLGRYPSISLKEARKGAMGYLSRTDHTKPLLDGKMRVTDAMESYLEDCEKANRPRTVKGYRRFLTIYLPKGTLADVTRPALAEILADLADRPTEQFHAHAAIRSFLNWCVEEEHIAHHSLPKLKSRALQPRKRVLTDHELTQLLRTAPNTTFGNLVRALIYTGQRRGEIAALRWEWVGDSTITIPAEIAKNDTEHTFPIGGLMRELLDTLPRTSPLVFPSATGLVISGWSKFKAQLDTDTKVTGYTLHDIRRSFVSIHARIGTPIHVTEKLVNHISGTFGGIVGTYNQHTYLSEMTEALLQYNIFLRSLTARG